MAVWTGASLALEHQFHTCRSVHLTDSWTLAQHEYQRALHLLHCHRDRTTPKSSTQFSHPSLHRFWFVLQFSGFTLPRIGRLQAPHMLLICPIDAHESYKLRLRLDSFLSCYSCFFILLGDPYRAEAGFAPSKSL